MIYEMNDTTSQMDYKPRKKYVKFEGKLPCHEKNKPYLYYGLHFHYGNDKFMLKVSLKTLILCLFKVKTLPCFRYNNG